MASLNVPANVGSTAKLRESMESAANALREAANNASEVRNQMMAAVFDSLIAIGVDSATASLASDELAHGLRTLDHALITAASYASDVARQTEYIAELDRNARANRGVKI